ncbi:hypothetical protein NKG94_06480 [Micromonospora sp. M12]
MNLLLGPAQEQVFTEFGLQRGEFDVLAALRRSGARTPSALTSVRPADALPSRDDQPTGPAGIRRNGGTFPGPRRPAQLPDPPHRKGSATVDAAMTQHTANVTALLAGLTPRN